MNGAISGTAQMRCESFDITASVYTSNRVHLPFCRHGQAALGIEHLAGLHFRHQSPAHCAFIRRFGRSGNCAPKPTFRRTARERRSETNTQNSGRSGPCYPECVASTHSSLSEHHDHITDGCRTLLSSPWTFAPSPSRVVQHYLSRGIMSAHLTDT